MASNPVWETKHLLLEQEGAVAHPKDQDSLGLQAVLASRRAPMACGSLDHPAGRPSSACLRHPAARVERPQVLHREGTSVALAIAHPDRLGHEDGGLDPPSSASASQIGPKEVDLHPSPSAPSCPARQEPSQESSLVPADPWAEDAHATAGLLARNHVDRVDP